MLLNRLKTFFTVFYHLLKVFFQMLKGVWRISILPDPIVTIYGGRRFDETDFYAQQAKILAHMLLKSDISVLTGGGGGIMKAVSAGYDGTIYYKGQSIGIGVSGLNERPNEYVSDYFELDYFFARKWLLNRASTAFVVFPGGFGTLDELAEILVLIQTKQQAKVPVILIGTEFWLPFTQWIKNNMMLHKTIDPEDLELFVVTDDLRRAFSLLCATCQMPEK